LIRIAIATLGCKVNQAESSAIVDQFDADNSHIVDWNEEADVYIINTCTVTNRTDYKSRYLIRQALAKKAANPLVKIVVTGCFAQRSNEEISELGGIDLIVDNQQKLDIASILSRGEYRFQDIMDAESFSFKTYSGMHEHTRAFQKIQDGCDFYCAYCAVPYARGHSRSASLDQVVQQAETFVANGYKEIVLGGVNLGLYKHGEHDLTEVINTLSRIDGLEMIRLSSIEPQLFSPQFIERIQNNPKLCPHFHIPLQSGSNGVLQTMGRRYDTALVSRLVKDLNAAFPFCAIGFDVITGFPGETEVQHQETYSFLSSLPITYLHVFSYSKRKGTPADKMPNQVPKDIKSERTTTLTQLSEKFLQAYQMSLIDNKVMLKGIVETYKNGESEFVSDHFVRVFVPEKLPIGQVATSIATKDTLLR
jgi:threonylcarbamoyladenosine tRNA methylthiotransferase MtaB